MLQGTVDMLVLRVLVAGPLHGYGIGLRLAGLSGDLISIDEGSLYVCLYRMEKKGWIRSEQRLSEANRRARYYSLTNTGIVQFDAEQRRWHQFERAVSRILSEA
jgi:transcriptional regulator